MATQTTQETQETQDNAPVTNNFVFAGVEYPIPQELGANYVASQIPLLAFKGITSQEQINDAIARSLKSVFGITQDIHTQALAEKLPAFNEELATRKDYSDAAKQFAAAMELYAARFGGAFHMASVKEDVVVTEINQETFVKHAERLAKAPIGTVYAFMPAERDDDDKEIKPVMWELTVPMPAEAKAARDMQVALVAKLAKDLLKMEEEQIGMSITENGSIELALKGAGRKAVSASTSGGTRFFKKTVRMNDANGKPVEMTGAWKDIVAWMYPRLPKTAVEVTRDGKKVKTSVRDNFKFQSERDGSSTARGEWQKNLGFTVWNVDKDGNRIPYEHDTQYVAPAN